jgi:cytochrome c biogenesis protein
MAQDVRTQPLPAKADDEGAFSGIDVVLEKIWHTLTSMKFAIIVLLGIAFLAMLGALIIQAPAGVTGDVTAKADWIDSIKPKIIPGVELLQSLPVVGALVPTIKYAAVAGLLDQLQLFEVFSSIWFRILIAALSISLIACTVQRIPGLWKTAMHPHVTVAPGFFDHAPQHETFVTRRTSAETFDDLSGVFKKHHYRVASADEGTVHIYADKHRWTGFASLAAHVALLVILLGVIIGGLYGYRDGNFILAEGQALPVPTMDGTTIKLESFKDSYYADTGAPSDYASDVVVYKGDQEIARHTIRVNDPLRLGEVSFYQSFYGPAAVLKVTGADDKVLVDEGVPLAWTLNEDGRRVGSITLPDAGMVAWVMATTGAADDTVQPGQVRIELYKTDEQGTAVGAQVIDQGKPTELGGLTFTFQRETQFTGLSVAKDPGELFVWLGAAILVAGFALVFMLPYRRMWARITPRPEGGSTVAMASAGRKDVTQGTEFADVIVDVRAALAAPRKI